jgi:superfamily II DNA or RNA helicase
MKRRFSKSQRNALWVASGGQCERCGQLLTLRNFDADHVIPWSAGGDTDLTNGAALCASCNREKGQSMLRKHQAQVQEVVRGVRDGRSITALLADVHPGGGKSALPMIVGKELFGSVIDRVAWIVPRNSLQRQAAAGSLDARLRAAVGHSFEFRESTNEIDPSRGTRGFVTTYQAIGVDSARTVLSDFRRYRYALILDEPHHVLADSSWHRMLQPLWDAASFRMLMTGTLSRGDRKSVAFMEYGSDGRPLVDRDGWDHVRYSRTDALHEKAIIKLNFAWGQGEVEWQEIGVADPKRARLQDCEDDDVRSAIHCALRSDYASHLLERAVNDWRGYQAQVYRDAQMIVVAPDQRTAREYTSVLRKLGVQAEIATSDDGAIAQGRIVAFQEGRFPALVTVAMAYEGLDVKAATHIVGLTHYRSAPWIEQMLNRATRYNPAQGAWERQEAFAYLPDDPLMREVVARIQKEQDEALKIIPDGPPGPPPPPKKEIFVLSGSLSGTRAEGLDDGLSINADADAEVRDLMREAGIEGVIPTQKLAEIIRMHDRRKIEPQAEEHKETSIANSASPVIKTAREREDSKRKQIEDWARRMDAEGSLDRGSTNRYLFSMFGKSRTQMNDAELQAVIDFISRRSRAA